MYVSMILRAYLSKTMNSTTIQKYRSYESSVAGAMDISGCLRSNMAI